MKKRHIIFVLLVLFAISIPAAEAFSFSDGWNWIRDLFGFEIKGEKVSASTIDETVSAVNGTVVSGKTCTDEECAKKFGDDNYYCLSGQMCVYCKIDGICDASKEDIVTCPEDCIVQNMCGDGKCTKNETCNSCGDDCACKQNETCVFDGSNYKCEPTNVCTALGQTRGKGGPACCDGLITKRSDALALDGTCIPITDLNICLECGDGVCDLDYENKCNCNEDCECSSDTDCAINKECENGKCILLDQQICTSDADCATGINKICDSSIGRCVQCLSSTACNEGYLCINKNCMWNTSYCLNNTACGTEKSCINNQCVTAVVPACTADENCSQGYSCEYNECLENCADNSDCSSNRVCHSIKKVCVLCEKNSQCVPGNSCDSSTSKCECDNDFDCFQGEYCTNENGKDLCRPEQKCISQANCSQGYICNSQICKKNCTSDLNCDYSRICTEDNFCEIPECLADSHCPNGTRCSKKKCINLTLCGDGVCDAISGEDCLNCNEDCGQCSTQTQGQIQQQIEQNNQGDLNYQASPYESNQQVSSLEEKPKSNIGLWMAIILILIIASGIGIFAFMKIKNKNSYDTNLQKNQQQPLWAQQKIEDKKLISQGSQNTIQPRTYSDEKYKKNNLENFIKTALTKGYSKEEIKKSLLAKGWKEQQIIGYFQEKI